MSLFTVPLYYCGQINYVVEAADATAAERIARARFVCDWPRPSNEWEEVARVGDVVPVVRPAAPTADELLQHGEPAGGHIGRYRYRLRGTAYTLAWVTTGVPCWVVLAEPEA